MNLINYNTIKMNQQRVINNLRIMYFIAIGIQVILFVAIAFRFLDFYPESTTISVVVERYALLVTLAGIPGALKLFSIIMEKKDKPNSTTNIQSYIKAFMIRFGILFLIASANIVLYGLSLNQNYMLCTLIVFTAYLFTLPSDKYFTKEEIVEEESDNENQL